MFDSNVGVATFGSAGISLTHPSDPVTLSLETVCCSLLPVVMAFYQRSENTMMLNAKFVHVCVCVSVFSGKSIQILTRFSRAKVHMP